MPSIEIELLTTDETLKRLCLLYWEVNEAPNFKYKVADISKALGISSIQMSAMLAEGCRAYSHQQVCPNCSTPHIFKNRVDYQSIFRGPEKLCDSCLLEAREIERVRKETELEKKKEIIRRTFSLSPRPALDIKSLTLEDAIGLLSFIRLTASESLISYGPLSSFAQPLAPTGLIIETTIRLMQAGHIIVHPNTSPEFFVFENGAPISMLTLHVTWALSTGDDLKATQDLITRLESTIKTRPIWPESWNGECLQLWRKIGIYECLEYLEVVLTEHKLPAKFGEKTHLVLTELIERFSVGQIYNMMWRAARDAAAFHARVGGPKQHAANTVIGSLQRQADRSNAEGWELKPYRRDRRCPQSMFSQILFDTALQIGERGFDKAPNVEEQIVDQT
ncbi:MAG: hypothetical protein EOP04_07455 [Proteobacteria bacterium]|nr:MAG: hypothetical protein EOP04_07455 [Pseudomonadota bacterium]